MKKKLLAAVIAAVGVLYLPYMLKLEDLLAVSNSILCIPAFLGYYALLNRMLDRANKRLYRFTLPLGLFFAACLSFGRQLNLYHTVNWTAHTTLVPIFVYSILMASLMGWIWEKVNRNSWVYDMEQKILLQKWSCFRGGLFINAGFLFLCWLSYWIACWPGNWVYDLSAVWDQYSRWQFTTWQPPFHSIFMCSIIDWVYRATGEFNQGIAVYTILQMGIIAILFSHMISSMKKWGVPAVMRLFSLCWLALFPLIPIAAISGTKDTFFAAYLLWLVTELLSLLFDDKVTKPQLLRIVMAAFLAMAYRNNAVYALAVFMIILLTGKGIRNKKKILGSISLAMICYFIWTGPVFQMLGVKREDSREMLSVPVQQIARIYKIIGPIAFSEEDRKLVWDIAEPEIWYRYAAKCSDPVKIDINMDTIEERTRDCIKMWIRTGLKYPQIYMDSFLENMVDSWYPDTVVNGYKEKHKENAAESDYFAVGVQSPGSEVESPLPDFKRALVQIASYVSYHKIPLVSMLFSIGANVWLMLMVFFYLWYHRDKKGWILLIPILYSMTILLGPMVLARYYFHVFFMTPMFVGLLFTEGHGTMSADIVPAPVRTVHRVGPSGTAYPKNVVQ